MWTVGILFSYIVAHWSAVFSILTTLVGQDIPLKTEYALLCAKPSDRFKIQFELKIHVLAATKQTIGKTWKIPTLSIAKMKLWISQMMLHEKIEAKVRLAIHLSFLFSFNRPVEQKTILNFYIHILNVDGGVTPTKLLYSDSVEASLSSEYTDQPCIAGYQPNLLCFPCSLTSHSVLLER